MCLKIYEWRKSVGKNGRLLADEREIMERWESYLKNLLDGKMKTEGSMINEDEMTEGVYYKSHDREIAER